MLSRPLMRALHRLAPVGFIVAIAAVGLGAFAINPTLLFNRYSDLPALHFGAQTVLHETWQREHRLPLWRSDQFSGVAAFGNPESMFTNPFDLLFLFWRPEQAAGVFVWLAMVTAAIGGYYCGRALRLSTASRLVLAVMVLFSFKTIMAVYAGWLSMLTAMAAVPFVFGALLMAIAS